MDALKVIKFDKATSYDCTNDFIVKELCKLDKNNLKDDQLKIATKFRDNLLEIVNSCLVRKELPKEA